jgi:NH3-dependent NAD+ synthetase
MEEKTQEKDIEREQGCDSVNINKMKKLISIPAPRFLNSSYRVNLDDVELPEGFVNYIVDLTRKGLDKIRQVTEDPKARLAVLLSGGVDSSVALKVGYDAVGSENVVALSIEHCTEKEQEIQDHKKRDKLISKLKVEEVRHNIDSIVNAELDILLKSAQTRKLFDKRPELLEIYKAEAVSRARILVMLNYCSLEGLYPIDTGNLTEAVFGQYTIGDSSGFAVNLFSLLLKEEVRKIGKDLDLDKEYYTQKKRTGEFGFSGSEQLGADERYLDPIAHLYLRGHEFKDIEKITGHDPKWLRKLEKRVKGKARIVRTSTCPIIDIEDKLVVPEFRDLWKRKLDSGENIAYKLQVTRDKYMPGGRK